MSEKYESNGNSLCSIVQNVLYFYVLIRITLVSYTYNPNFILYKDNMLNLLLTLSY